MSSDGIAEFKEQNYEQLKQDCVANRTLFCDPEFPPKKSSLIYSKSVLSQKIQWKRPQVSLIKRLNTLPINAVACETFLF
jgi:hypothetical protein